MYTLRLVDILSLVGILNLGICACISAINLVEYWVID
jgi:hypothetical protein